MKSAKQSPSFRAVTIVFTPSWEYCLFPR